MSDPLPPGWYHDPLGGPGARYWDGSGWSSSQLAEEPLSEIPVEAPQKRSLLMPISVGVAVFSALIAVALIAMWPEKQSTPKLSPVATPPPTKTVTATQTTPTITPAADIAAMVKKSMQRKFDTDPDVSVLGLRVVDVKLVNKAGNEYKGYATIHAGNGETDDVPVEVTADGDNTLWETPPGALAFAIPDMTTSPVRPFPVPGADSFGFFDGPRCSMLDTAALIIRTEQSGVVICRNDAPNSYTYHGLRLSDGAQITLPARSVEGGGFSAVNSDDGTRYEVTREGLSIYTPDGETFREPATAFGP